MCPWKSAHLCQLSFSDSNSSATRQESASDSTCHHQSQLQQPHQRNHAETPLWPLARPDFTWATIPCALSDYTLDVSQHSSGTACCSHWWLIGASAQCWFLLCDGAAGATGLNRLESGGLSLLAEVRWSSVAHANWRQWCCLGYLRRRPRHPCCYEQRAAEVATSASSLIRAEIAHGQSSFSGSDFRGGWVNRAHHASLV